MKVCDVIEPLSLNGKRIAKCNKYYYEIVAVMPGRKTLLATVYYTTTAFINEQMRVGNVEWQLLDDLKEYNVL